MVANYKKTLILDIFCPNKVNGFSFHLGMPMACSPLPPQLKNFRKKSVGEDQKIFSLSKFYYPGDIEMLGWCPVGSALPHAEKVRH